jgi:hypothetical protein
MQAKLLKVLAHHDQVERQEHDLCERDLEPHFEPESSEEEQEAKCQKDANKDICMMVKPSKFHGKDNTTP